MECKITAVIDDGGKLRLVVDSGTNIEFRIGVPEFIEHCKKHGKTPIGCYVSIIDDGWMEVNWSKVKAVYSRIKTALPKYCNPPTSFAEFRKIPYDLIDNSKPYVFYPTREWQINGAHNHLWVYDNGERVRIDFSGTEPRVVGITKDLVR